MNDKSYARKGFFISLVMAILLVVIFLLVHEKMPEWLPQIIVTLAGLVGLSWFAGRRLDLIDKGIHQRQQAATDQLIATKRGNLNGAIKEAVEMMSRGPAPSILAGQRWLHQIAGDDRQEAELARALLCSHIASGTTPELRSGSDSEQDAELHAKTRQAALNLLFGSHGRERYKGCRDAADLSGSNWRNLDFRGLSMIDCIFRKGDFTNATIEDAHFDGSDCRETTWGGKVGGHTQTSMVRVKMNGARALSCIFENIDFRGADMSMDGRKTQMEFANCKFINCDFDGAKWTGVLFKYPEFQRCSNLTFKLCHDADLVRPKGLPPDVLEELERKGVGGLRSDESDEQGAT